MTVLEAIKRSTEFLTRKGLESPRLNAESLLAHVLSLPRMGLYLNFERELTQAELEASRELLRRRGQREPLQLILGTTSFCGFEIAVTRDALIPRPETELLAETAWAWLRDREPGSGSNREASVVLDWGTGTGCIAIAIARHCPEAVIHAIDISPAALDLARRNAAQNNVLERIHLAVGNGFVAVPEGVRFDLVVSNPPYIATGDIEGLEPEVRNHDPATALDGGLDGLEIYRQLAAQTEVYLKPGGRIMLEFGDGQADPLREIFTRQNWIVEGVKQDYTQRPRILIASRMDTNG